MLRKSFLYALAAFAVCASLSAATVEFRGGTLLSAEISSCRPKLDIPASTLPNRVYACIVFELARERDISIHDWALSAFGRNFKAIAVCSGGGKWLTDGNVVKNTGDRMALLFELDGTLVSNQRSATLELVALPDSKAAPQEVKFKNIDDSSFTGIDDVPSKGSMAK